MDSGARHPHQPCQRRRSIKWSCDETSRGAWHPPKSWVPGTTRIGMLFSTRLDFPGGFSGRGAAAKTAPLGLPALQECLLSGGASATRSLNRNTVHTVRRDVLKETAKASGDGLSSQVPSPTHRQNWGPSWPIRGASRNMSIACGPNPQTTSVNM